MPICVVKSGSTLQASSRAPNPSNAGYAGRQARAVVNSKPCERSSLDVPPMLLALADEVIDWSRARRLPVQAV
jgi:hypothetical protein